ncbi:MAG: stalk domain-containing protein, partial [Caldisericaceae bacterium]
IPATSNTYSITGTSVSNLTVAADPTTQNSIAAYTFNFRTSSTGALSRTSSDKIYIQFPTDFVTPSSVAGNYVTVNNTQCASSVSISNDKLTITTPVDIGNSSSVTVVISSSGAIRNPPTPNSYQFSVSTSKDVVPQTANLTIVKSTITKPTVQLTSYAVNDAVGLTITFQTGTGGALSTSDKISIVFPAGFVLPSSISNTYVKVNNYTSLSVSKSGQRLDITVPFNIPASSQITVSIDKAANIKNPPSQNDYSIGVYTSQETTQMNSDTFKIVNLPVTTAVVVPQNPDGQNGYYVTTPKVTLTATSPIDTAPVIYYFFDNNSPQVYSGVISVPDGSHTLNFYAQDKYQNKEVTQSKQFKVDTVPPTITVSYPQQNAILNTKNFTITGSTEPGATLTINNTPVNVGAQGNFSYDTSITGPVSFTLVAKDAAGNTKQFVLNVSLDTTPPKLTVSEPSAFQEIHTQFVTVKGQTEKDATVKINGTPIALNADYSFSYSLTLTTQGLNAIEVTATDLAGNVATVSIPVKFIPKTKIIIQVGNTNGIVNDKTVKLEAAPKITNGRTLVPIRFVAEAFGATVKWNPVFKLVTINLSDKEIILQIGTNYASVNGVKYSLDAAPSISSGVTFVPIRFISDSLNASVDWDAGTKTVTIIYPK